jgi:hypothetical protein
MTCSRSRNITFRKSVNPARIVNDVDALGSQFSRTCDYSE